MITVICAALVFTLLPLRIVLASLSIATWTAAWTTINLLTLPLVAPFRLLGPLNGNVVGRMQLADLAALLVLGGITVYMLAMLTVRRHR